MDIDIITQYILSSVPAVSALTGMAVIVGVGVAKIKKAFTQRDADLNTHLNEVHQENLSLKRENREIKEELKKITKDIHKIHTKGD